MALGIMEYFYYMLHVIYAKCRKYAHYAYCHYAECRYAECCGTV